MMEYEAEELAFEFVHFNPPPPAVVGSQRT
jgi:hypothetical protein